MHSGLRFLIVNTDYPHLIRSLYAQRPGLEERSYEEQLQARMGTLLGLADFYSSNLRKLGHEAIDVLANHEALQFAWTREHGLKRRRHYWHFSLRRGFVPWIRHVDVQLGIYEILAAQVKEFRPDVLFCMCMETIGSDFLHDIDSYYHLAVGQHAAPLPRIDVSAYDLVLSSLPNQVDFFREQGLRSEYFRLGFESAILDRIPASEQTQDVTFVGGLSRSHSQRVLLLEELSRKTCVRIWGYGVESLSSHSPIRKRYQGEIWGRDMYALLARSKISINQHIDVAGPYANNRRLYDSTGLKCMLLTDHQCNIADLFEPAKEVVTYRNAEECVELISHYLEHSDEREAIAKAGQQRTLREHTFYHRMQELVDIVERYLK